MRARKGPREEIAAKRPHGGKPAKKANPGKSGPEVIADPVLVGLAGAVGSSSLRPWSGWCLGHAFPVGISTRAPGRNRTTERPGRRAPQPQTRQGRNPENETDAKKTPGETRQKKTEIWDRRTPRNRLHAGTTSDWVGSSEVPPRAGAAGSSSFRPWWVRCWGPALHCWLAEVGSSSFAPGWSGVGVEHFPVGISRWTPGRNHTTDSTGSRAPQHKANRGRTPEVETKPPRNVPGKKPTKQAKPGKMG